MQKHLLGGSFETDPFRLIKVSDFVPVGEGESEVTRKIQYSVSLAKKDKKRAWKELQKRLGLLRKEAAAPAGAKDV